MGALGETSSVSSYTLEFCNTCMQPSFAAGTWCASMLFERLWRIFAQVIQHTSARKSFRSSQDCKYGLKKRWDKKVHNKQPQVADQEWSSQAGKCALLGITTYDRRMLTNPKLYFQQVSANDDVLRMHTNQHTCRDLNQHTCRALICTCWTLPFITWIEWDITSRIWT